MNDRTERVSEQATQLAQVRQRRGTNQGIGILGPAQENVEQNFFVFDHHGTQVSHHLHQHLANFQTHLRRPLL